MDKAEGWKDGGVGEGRKGLTRKEKKKGINKKGKKRKKGEGEREMTWSL